MLLWRQLSATLLAAGLKALAGRGMPAVAEAEPVATQAVGQGELRRRAE